MNIKLIFIILPTLLASCFEKSDKKKSETNNEIVDVYKEPRHNLVYEHKDFKIVDIQIKPNDTTLFHRHINPMFSVSLGWQPYEYQALNSKWEIGSYEEWQLGEMGIDSSYLIKPLIHRVTNVGTKPSRLIGILNTGKGLNFKDKSDFKNSKNRWFRAKRIELDRNERLDYQELEFPIVVINVSKNDIEVIKDNKYFPHNKEWLVLEEMTQLKNSSNHKIELIQIEILK